MCSTENGAVGPAPVHELVPARPAKQGTQLVPSAVSNYILDQMGNFSEPIEDWQVPKAVSSNKLWRHIASAAKSVYSLYAADDIVALLVVLHDTGLQVVFKAWPSQTSPQEAAELTAAEEFPWHPIMPTMVAFCDGDGEGKQRGWCCSVTTYAGPSIQSLIKYPRWYQTISAHDRLEFAKLLIVQSLMAFEVMQQTGPGYYHRDVKPDNLCVDPTTGWLISVIDYGLMIPSDLQNFYHGFTDGYYTPELVNPKGNFRAFKRGNLRDSTINATTDVFLTSFVALEVAVGLSGLPWVLQAGKHDISTDKGLIELLYEHARAAVEGYDALINRVSCPTAREFFQWTMCINERLRPTPAEALQHPWLEECKTAVQEALVTETTAYKADNQMVVNLFSKVPGVILPQPHPQHQEVPEVNHSSTASLYSADSFDSFDSFNSAASLDLLFNPLVASQTADLRCDSSLSIKRCSADEQVEDQLPAAATAAEDKQVSGMLQHGKELLARLSSSDSAASLSLGADEDSGADDNSAAINHSAAIQDADASLLSGADIDSADTHSPAGSIKWCNSSLLIKRASHDELTKDQLPAAAAAAAVRKQLRGVVHRGKMLLGKLSKRSQHRSGASDDSATAGSCCKAATTNAVRVHVQGYLDDEEPCAVSVPGFCGLRWFRGNKNAS